MKPLILTSLVTAIALGSSPFLGAAPIDELVASLRVEIEKSIVEAKAAKNTSAMSTSYETERQMSRLENAIAKENYEEATQTLDQLAVSRLSVEAKERISQLQKDIPKASEERQKAYAAQVGATIEKAGKACLAAKRENDLDAIIAELGALKRQRADGSSGYSETRQRLNARLDGAIRFVNRWQDYLVQTAGGYDAAGRSVMRELSDPTSSQYYPILRRADILARIGKDQESSPDDVLREVKTLDDIPKASTELTRLSRESRSTGNYEFNSPITELNQISRAYAAFKAGNYGSAMAGAAQMDSSGGSKSAETMRLRTMLLLSVLPRYLELPDNPQPKAGENPSDFLLRIAREGAAQNDWSRVARALDAYRTSAFGHAAYGNRPAPAWIGADMEACQQYVAGQNLEKAGRYVPAILAYQRAIRTVGQYGPQKAAGERLALLEKEQPAAFQEAGKEPQMRELLDAIRSSGSSRANPFSTPVFDQ
jgi:hypothetical protein